LHNSDANRHLDSHVPKRLFVDSKAVKGLEGITELKSRSDASKDNTKILMTNNSIDKNGRPASSIMSQRNYSKREAVREIVGLYSGQEERQSKTIECLIL
jgi:hypothetical protein